MKKKFPKLTKDILTTKQLAERWGLKPLTLAIWRMRDKLLMEKGKPTKGPDWLKLSNTLQGEVRYSRKDIEAYEKRNIVRIEKSRNYKRKTVKTIRVKITKNKPKRREVRGRK